ncbi:MAG TPA: patatin-like phospholipase family protein [Burkholderiales bacterium]|nr:patatin-like phospholipase family protein [Burkholderiales bacterium]
MKSYGQTVLVLQGGGALGAYQGGVFEALHEAGLEPDWVIGTSIGAINGAIIAANPPGERLPRLREFWRRIVQDSPLFAPALWPGMGEALEHLSTLTRGVPGFFAPRLPSWGGVSAPVGVDLASYYSTEPLRETLGELVDLAVLGQRKPRLTIGAVNVTRGEMHYFDSGTMELALDHVMASGALPPWFPAVRIGGEAYWDGGIYSNTPIEVVFNDDPRRDSLIFAVNVWQPTGHEPESIWQVMGRQKDIQYASRADSQIARQKQIHHLRRVIRELASYVSPEERASAHVQKLDTWGCSTTMHVVRLLAPALASEDYWKDIDFSSAGIGARWQAGLDDARRMIAAAPWRAPVDPMEGVVVHELSARTGG